MTRKGAFLAAAVASAALVPGLAIAQPRQPGEDLTVVVTLAGPPAAANLVLDTALLVSLAYDGTARRGLAVNNLVFASINTLMSLILIAAGPMPPDASPTWRPLCYSALTLSAASVMVSIYAMVRTPALPEAPLEAPERAPPFPVPYRPVRPADPQLDSGPTLLFTPYLGFAPGGSVSGGGQFLVRW